MVQLSGDRSFVVADVPGLIEGAHLGHGLGTKFLAHLERTKVLVHMVDVSSTGRDPVQDYDVIVRELELFAGAGDDTAVALAAKPQIAAATKIDALDEPERLERLREHLQARGVPLMVISSATGEGLPALLEAMWRKSAPPRHRPAWNALGIFGGTFDPCVGHLDVPSRAARSSSSACCSCRPTCRHIARSHARRRLIASPWRRWPCRDTRGWASGCRGCRRPSRRSRPRRSIGC